MTGRIRSWARSSHHGRIVRRGSAPEGGVLRIRRGRGAALKVSLAGRSTHSSGWFSDLTWARRQ